MSAMQGSGEWFAQRLGKVTASRIADILNATARNSYMMELITEIVTGKRCKEFVGNADTERGVELEPIARANYELITGEFVQLASFVSHPLIKQSGASPDGFVSNEGLIEIKCPRSYTHISYMTSGSVPAKYIPQMAWQLACTGRKWVDFVSYCNDMPNHMSLYLKRYKPEDGYIEKLEKKVKEFIKEMDEKLAMLPKPGDVTNV